MELEEMQALWQETNKKLEAQKLLTDQLIIDMTQERYRNKFTTITNFEMAGSIICLLVGIAILIHLKQLDTWYLLACGLFSAIYFIALPFFVLRALYRLSNLNLAGGSSRETLIEFSKRKKAVLLTQQIGMLLNLVLLVVSLPVATKIMKGKDIFLGSNVWWWYLPTMGIVLFFISRWGYRCYRSITA
ncbi:MAG: hypothetical protein AAFU03_06065, partial [Bacteroidota bacterium]